MKAYRQNLITQEENQENCSTHSLLPKRMHHHNIHSRRRYSPLILISPDAQSAMSTDDDKTPPVPITDLPTDQDIPTQVWEIPPISPSLRPHYKGHPRPSPTILPSQPESAEKWRVPTILVLTFSVALGIAMMLFLMWVAYRKIKKLQQLRRIERQDRQEMVLRI
jgi:hypothetical protein